VITLSEVSCYSKNQFCCFALLLLLTYFPLQYQSTLDVIRITLWQLSVICLVGFQILLIFFQSNRVFFRESPFRRYPEEDAFFCPQEFWHKYTRDRNRSFVTHQELDWYRDSIRRIRESIWVISDRIARLENRLWLLESRTATTPNEEWFDMWDFAFRIRIYFELYSVMKRWINIWSLEFKYAHSFRYRVVSQTFRLLLYKGRVE